MKARGAVLSRRSAHTATVTDWRTLVVGEAVEVVKYAHVVATGRVEEVSGSGNVVWLEHSGSGVTEEGKELFMKSDGVTLRRA
ncbi:hypothetical protein J2790_002876 [Paenarthrobacter nicotinovorans]|uniref:hypothetical protein n=1 Tax=Micrococcaceae TaxID=1268 RepID=UPI000478EEAA|nr:MULTISPECIES: hypothetical protein [Micrococcaceae]MDR6437727.1 hypothetical protein [Paenarthrobacter nicotinovorans]BCW57118.1 hypothetical protein StoSoilB20_04650 [Arthrobacter sp. StoSoilB20]SCZ61307.1 hypothetical protein SAMN02799638_03158 [Arthrobacter sp. UNCCL28]